MDKGLTNAEKAKKRKEAREKSDGEKKVMVTIQFVKCISGIVQHTRRRHGIATAVKQYKTLRQLLMHPKDKRDVKDMTLVAYYIRCQDCPMVYIGERGMRFGVREKVYRKDVEELEGVKFTWVRKRESTTWLSRTMQVKRTP